MKIFRPLSVVALALVVSLGAEAQRKKEKESEAKAPAVEAPKPATPPAKKPEAPKKGPKSFKEVIDSTAVTQKGLMNVHKVADKWYFEVADSLLGRDIMTITRYAKTAAGAGVFGGEEVNRQVIRWEMGPSDNLFMRSVTYVLMSPDSTKPIAQAVKNSSADPIVASFEIKAIKKEGKNKSYVIEVNSTFDADNQIFSLSPIDKQRFNIAAFQKDRSYIQKISSYPINTEIRTVKTFSVNPPRISLTPAPQIGTYFPASLDAGVVTMEFNTSMILLPKTPMRSRTFDARVGYFANQYSVFGEESQKSDQNVFAVRWRLEPKNAADAEKQKRGELIEPAKPIVFYIDPATPEKWRKYLKMGVDDWSVAFEAAGWKNAIRGEYWPENDTTMSLEDARYSVIRYFAADIQNAYGPNVHDPRSGEIIESHIGWYHNVMRLLRNWYMIQAAAVDPAARTKNFKDDLMGQLVRFVSSHEVGHTLGLRHNMGASAATPVEKLRDPKFIEKNGHTSSIMDYARFNYVAQPEDGVKDLFPRIGDYDIWAIKWGYSYFADAKSEADEKKVLNEWTKEAYKNIRLRFGTEISPHDPRYQTEDVGDNSMKASTYGIKNLKRIVPNLIEWSKEDGESYQELDELYGNVVAQYRRYLGHVTKNIGGIYDTPVTYDMKENQFEVTPKAIQKEAVTFLNEQLFRTPTWLLDQNIMNKIRPETGVEAIKSIQVSTLNSVLSGDRVVRLIESTTLNASNYSLDELMTDLQSSIFSELKGKTSIDVYRRNLQKAYAERVIALLEPGRAVVTAIPVGATYGFNRKTVELSQTDLPSVARAYLEKLQADIQAGMPKMTDNLSRYHLKDLQRRISAALDPKK
ncbi:MAG: zinc-dependent metalloprotease [Spirosomataceae bacterium]